MTTSVFHVFLPNLFTTYYKLNLAASSNISSIGAITMAIFSLIFAYFTSITNAVRILRTALFGMTAVLLLICFTPINISQILQHNTIWLYLLITLISIILSGVNGIFFGILAGLFPTQVRFSGISICYNIAYILGAGLTPLWATSIMHFTGSYNIIIFVCALVTLISLINTVRVKNLSMALTIK